MTRKPAAVTEFSKKLNNLPRKNRRNSFGRTNIQRATAPLPNPCARETYQRLVAKRQEDKCHREKQIHDTLCSNLGIAREEQSVLETQCLTRCEYIRQALGDDENPNHDEKDRERIHDLATFAT